MNILYIHGWGSKFDPNSDKSVFLARMATVFGINVDYANYSLQNIKNVSDYCIENSIDLIVGCSMGGWLASHVGAKTGTPFVALNPATNPSKSLKKYEGTGVNYDGTNYNLTPDVISSYGKFNRNGAGLILLKTGDELINYKDTVDELNDDYRIVIDSGGDHRFTDLDTSHIEIITSFYESVQNIYGLSE